MKNIVLTLYSYARSTTAGQGARGKAPESTLGRVPPIVEITQFLEIYKPDDSGKGGRQLCQLASKYLQRAAQLRLQDSNGLQN